MSATVRDIPNTGNSMVLTVRPQGSPRASRSNSSTLLVPLAAPTGAVVPRDLISQRLTRVGRGLLTATPALLVRGPSPAIRKPRRRPGQPARGEEPTAKVPLRWYTRPLYGRLRTITRPPTAKTRRVLLEVEQPMPLEAFEAFMAPMADDERLEIKRDKKNHLEPTRSTGTSNYFEFLIDNPLLYDKLFALDSINENKHPRGLGCARVNLSPSMEKQGILATSISLPFGNVSVVFREPRRKRGMPVLTVRLFM